MKIRRCPGCGIDLPVGCYIPFDSEHNMICPDCGKPILAATAKAELEIKVKSKVPPVTTSYHYNRQMAAYDDCN